MSLTRMPRVGERVRFPTGRHAGVPLTVHHLAGNLVWCLYPDGAVMPFIGFFDSDKTFNTQAEIIE